MDSNLQKRKYGYETIIRTGKKKLDFFNVFRELNFAENIFNESKLINQGEYQLIVPTRKPKNKIKSSNNKKNVAFKIKKKN